MDLVEYADRHGFQAGPHIYEDILLDEMSTKGYDNYTIKLSLPLISEV